MRKNKNNNLSVLLEDTNLSYYWVGFLLADGTFYEKRIKLHLGQKDTVHVQQFAKFIEMDGEIKNCISPMDSILVPIIRKKFDINNLKTYYPPDMNWIKDDNLFLSLVVGFIDGDGNIKKVTNREDASLTIKCHSSWLNNLDLINNRICNMIGIKCNNIVKLNNQGYARLIWTNSKVLRFLKKSTISLELPVLERKWNLIDENFISRQEIGEKRVNQVRELLENGWSKGNIASYLGVGQSCVSQIIKRNNLKSYTGQRRNL